MRRLYIAMLLATLLMGCGAPNVEVQMPSADMPRYDDLIATLDEGSTRVYMEEDLSLAWDKEDSISVFYGNNFNNLFVFNGASGDKSGSFSLEGNGGVGLISLDRIYALYPYQTMATIASDGSISLLIPENQSYVAGSFPRDGNVMVAVTESTEDVALAFRNAVGYLKLKLWGAGTVKSITVKGNGDEKIAGAAQLSASKGSVPVLTMAAEATTEITLNCGDGVALCGDSDNPTEFCVAVPETTFESGITITVADTANGTFTRSTSQKVVVERNYIKPMAVLQVEFEATAPTPRQLWYTTSDGERLSFRSDAFGADVVEQECVDGRWVVTCANDITSIGNDAFYMQSSLTGVTFSDSLTSIGEYTFYGCKALRDVTLPSSITALGAASFCDCDSLTTMVLPEAVSSIGDGAFMDCDSLTSVYSMAAIPPDIGTNIFDKARVTIYVPDFAYSDYKSHLRWGEYNIFGEPYTSTDFSADGEVVLLQGAAEGNGIDIVVMGDGYSDRHIANGRYESDMRRAVEHIFSEEPYTSFRHLFNVYMVKCVSTLEGCSNDYEYGSTAINCRVKSDGISIEGDSWVPHGYAKQILGEARYDEAMIIVIMNSNIHAGVCYMREPEVNTTHSYGNGNSLSYFPLCGNDDAFRELILHEACGHGFAKLGDEYSYSGNGHIREGAYYDIKHFETWGWYKNIDCVLSGALDATTVKWSHFLADSRYANEGLGVFEGAYTYATGAYRPSEDSMMHHRKCGFNAPSREAIYIRIHKLAYGNDWNYSYEEFVAYDIQARLQAL